MSASTTITPAHLRSANDGSRTIGQTTTYHGTEHGYLRGCRVRIVAVMKGGADPDVDPDGPDYQYLTDDDSIRQAGGVTARDRVEVQPWLEREGRWSFVTSDPRADDLRRYLRLRTVA